MTIERAGDLAMARSRTKKISVALAVSQIYQEHRNELPASITISAICSHLQSRNPQPISRVKVPRKKPQPGSRPTFVESLFPGFNPAPTALGRR
jgi:hypothetical protein